MKKTSNTRPDLNGTRKELEAIMAMGHNSYSVYEDWIGLMFCAYLHDEARYMEIMGRYANTAPVGHREADHFCNALGLALYHIQTTGEEVLGQLFMEYASNHYRGQYFTPMEVARMTAAMTLVNMPEDRRFTIADPCCGSGVMLIAASKEMSAEQQARAIFVGQDIDLNCARMCALNLMFFNLDGVVIWGNTLALEARAGWMSQRSPVGACLKPMSLEEAKRWAGGSAQAAKETKKSCRQEQMSLF